MESIEVTRISPLTGKEHKITIRARMEDVLKWECGGMMVQEALPYLTRNEREFLMTGITSEEWDAAFGESEDSSEMD